MSMRDSNRIASLEREIAKLKDALAQFEIRIAELVTKQQEPASGKTVRQRSGRDMRG